jgi:hypothetical protein
MLASSGLPGRRQRRAEQGDLRAAMLAGDARMDDRMAGWPDHGCAWSSRVAVQVGPGHPDRLEGGRGAVATFALAGDASRLVIGYG